MMSKWVLPVVVGMGFLAAGSSARFPALSQAPPVAPLFRANNAPYAPYASNVNPNDPNISYSLVPVISSGLTRPIFITHANDDRLFIMEQGGLIKIWQSGALLPAAFLSVTNIVQTNNNGYSEEGLLGLAFEPNYTSTGRFYIYYTNASGDQNIARYTVSSGNANLADPLSATLLMTISHPGQANHNGGWMSFGPDGLLYVAVGDGGIGSDPFCAAQNTNELRGKLLRLNVVGQITYTTPATNTFTTTQYSEVWAIGLRNPWRNSFDRQTGDLYVADVGQDSWEEVNFVPAALAAGANFDWSQREGRTTYSSGCPSSTIIATEPFTDYAHNPNSGYSVTGGYVYRGVSYPWLNGAYFFADFGTGHVWAAWQPGATGVFSTAKIATTGFHVVSFGEDSAGEIYLADYAGQVVRLSSTQSEPSTATPTPTLTATISPSPISPRTFMPLVFAANSDVSLATTTPIPTITIEIPEKPTRVLPPIPATPTDRPSLPPATTNPTEF